MSGRSDSLSGIQRAREFHRSLEERRPSVRYSDFLIIPIQFSGLRGGAEKEATRFSQAE